MDIPTLRDAKPGDLITAANAYSTLQDSFGKHAETWKDGVDTRVKNSGWTGDAGGQAQQSLTQTTAKLSAAQIELGMIGPVLKDGSEAFLLAQSKLLDALADAKAGGFTVDDDGGVSWPPTSAAERHDPDFKDPSSEGKAISKRINDALNEAAHADQVIAERLRHYTDAAKNGTGLDLGTATMELTSKITNVFGGDEDLIDTAMPPANASPTEVNSWWNGLTADEQKRLIQEHPDKFGNRDGIPVAARDQANRIMLPRLIKQYEEKNPKDDWDQKKLDGFKAIEKRIAEEDKDPGPPPVYLVGVSDEGQGRGIISFGNPDTAKNTTAYVPGLTTVLSDVGDSGAGSAKEVWKSTEAGNGNKGDTASMMWLGYDAPQLGANLETGDVTLKDRAEKGGESYQRFMQGMRATHEGSPGHLVALGHSYGSLTVGQAAQRDGGIPVDDIILIGSPGVGAEKASDLKIDPKHVWVGAAMLDPVTHMPSKAEAGGGLIAGPIGGAVGHVVDPHQLWHGQDPASEDFGAQRFAVHPGHDLADQFNNHSDYMNSNGGPSLGNIGAIVGGHPEKVVHDDHR
ncbi:alpha/beta hydrolase [Kitasatospora sp. NPDC050543]|uniref:alpha/beta hydrolase n=1 Tax=Kitasatospora sp. NPDC050543 TaxID=3364054 RepID=UPI0037B00466